MILAFQTKYFNTVTDIRQMVKILKGWIKTGHLNKVNDDN